uniref:MFS domain-containing protein n=1 Tax=Caenorhabditis japonica TaxID=281687 RepID=A0A8R1E5A8_CAEJA
MKTPAIVPNAIFGANNFMIPNMIEDQGKVVFICLITVLFSILPVGYHMAMLNVPEKVIQQFIFQNFENIFGLKLSPAQESLVWSLTVSSQGVGALIGCLLVGPMAKFGAKHVLMGLNNVILIAGSLLMFLSYWMSFPIAFILGRILTGVYTGLACAFAPLYLQQVIPKNIKGSMSCFLHIAVCFGSSLGAIFSLPFMFGSDTTWPTLVIFPAFFGLAILVASVWIPDTPNNLLQKGRYTEAIQSIKFYYDIEDSDEDEIIKEYWDMVPEMPEQLTICAAFMNPSIRNGILLGMIVSSTQIFSGSMVSISYSTEMFEAVSFIDTLVPFLPALGSIFSILLTIPALRWVETRGRRPLLLKTLLFCIAANFLLLVFTLISSDTTGWASWGFAAAFFMYGIGYNLGVGPVAYFLPAELVPPEAASASLGSAVAVNWMCTITTTLFYYPLSKSIGGWSYLIFIIPTSLFTMILWRLLPETKFHYKIDPLEIRLLTDIGPSITSNYGTLDGEEPTLF